MKLKILALAVCIFCSGDILGQDLFDRVYRAPGRSMISVDMVASGNTFYVLSKFDQERDTIQGLNVTNLDKKGSINWSRDYIFYEDSSAVETEGSIILTDDGIMLSAVVVDTLAELSNVVLGLGSTGLVEYAQAYGSNTEDELTVGNSILTNAVDPEEVFLFGNNFTADGVSLFASKLDLAGEVIWAADLHARDTLNNEFDEEAVDVVFSYDSTYLTIGTLDDESVFVFNHDEDGNQIYSRSYSTVGNFDTEASGAISLPDSTFFISTYLTNNNGNTVGGIIKLDSLGNILWGKQITAALGLGTIRVNDIAVAENGTIIIGGNIEAPNVNGAIDEGEFIVTMNSEGLVENQRVYQIIDGRGPLRSGILATTEDGGFAYAATSFDERTSADTLLIRMIKTDDMGDLGPLINGDDCHTELIGLLIDDLEFSQDTLVWSADLIENPVDSIDVFEDSFSFDVQVLSLQDTMFCPGDPVEFELDATTRDAVAYRWFKADEPDMILGTDSTFIATELMVNYVAEVKIETDNCFLLCDTTQLTEIMPPMITVGRNTGQLCVNNQIVLIVDGAGNNTIDWSTGESTPQILVGEPGTYSVVVTNECDDTAEASATISEADFYQAGGGIATPDFDNCSNGTVPILLETTGDVIAVDWNTGATGNRISVSEAGVYTATITDLCGMQTEASVEITAAEIFGCSDGDCPEGSTDTENACLCWPNAFVPASQSEENATFGPNNRCPNISSYNLRVYNRWGEKVFESENVSTEWTGQRGSKLAPSEVYAFYVVYEVEGVEIEDKGHVTLIR